MEHLVVAMYQSPSGLLGLRDCFRFLVGWSVVCSAGVVFSALRVRFLVANMKVKARIYKQRR
jgi:hypothetical protein